MTAIMAGQFKSLRTIKEDKLDCSDIILLPQNHFRDLLIKIFILYVVTILNW
jgi:hypothetical protein